MLKNRLLIVAAVMALVACNKGGSDAPAPAGSSSDVPTVADYLHDIDAARAVQKLAVNNPAKYQDDPKAINAQTAISKLGASLNKCWPMGQMNTAHTDHACLDAQGYKR